MYSPASSEMYSPASSTTSTRKKRRLYPIRKTTRLKNHSLSPKIKHFTQLHNNSFISSTIVSWCNKHYKFYRTYKPNNKTCIRIATKKRDNTHDIRMISLIINSMRIAFNAQQKIVLTYLPSSFAKKWNNRDILNSDHVNSGFTRILSDKSEIVVYRKEEHRKVIIHELIHAFCLHCSQGTVDSPLYDESIVEAWATILNCLFMKTRNTPAHKYQTVTISTNSPSDYYHLFNTKHFIDEVDYSLKQTSRLLKYHGCLNIQCSEKLPKIPAVFQYYVVKTALLCQPKRFVNEFFWSNIKQCSKFKVDDINNYLDQSFIDKLMTVEPFEGDSMRMTLYG